MMGTVSVGRFHFLGGAPLTERSEDLSTDSVTTTTPEK